VYFAFGDDTHKTYKAGRNYSIVSEKEIINIPDNDFIKELPQYKKAFKDMSISFLSTEAIAREKIERTKEVDIDEKTENKVIKSSFSLEGIDISTEYEEKEDRSRISARNNQNKNMEMSEDELERYRREYEANPQKATDTPFLIQDDKEHKNIPQDIQDKSDDPLVSDPMVIKQTIRINNRTNKDQVITFSNKIEIDTDEIEYEGIKHQITEEPQIYQAYEKTASIPEFAQDSGNADLEGIDQFKNYTHSYTVGTRLNFQTKKDNQ
jgi:hypothetical protein